MNKLQFAYWPESIEPCYYNTHISTFKGKIHGQISVDGKFCGLQQSVRQY